MGNQNIDSVVLIIFLVIMLFVVVVNNLGAKYAITDYLQKRKAKNIVITREWLDFDRDTLTFTVEFTDSNGKKISTRCKIRRLAIFIDEEIFWTEPIELKTSKSKRKNT